jgi:hypothetical protein
LHGISSAIQDYNYKNIIMKKFITISGFFLLLSILSYAQVADSATVAKIVEKGNKPIAVNNGNSLARTDATGAYVITFLPVILFLLILLMVLGKLKKDGAKLSDFLVDKDAAIAAKKEETAATTATANATIATANAIKANAAVFAATNTVPPPVTVPVAAIETTEPDEKKPEQSTSRLLAFITGITTLAMATCVTSFYFYRSFQGEPKIDLGSLATVLYGLGLGIIPYGFNKISNAMK